jgi:hypothetical protein
MASETSAGRHYSASQTKEALLEWIIGNRTGREGISLSDSWLAASVKAVQGTQYHSILASIDPYGDTTLDPSRVVILRDALLEVLRTMKDQGSKRSSAKHFHKRAHEHKERPAGTTVSEHQAVAQEVLSFLEKAVAAKQPVVLVGD